MNFFSRSHAALTPDELRAQFDEAAAEFDAKALHHISRFGDADQRTLAQALLAGGTVNGSVIACAAGPRWAYSEMLWKSWRRRKLKDSTLR